MAVGGLGLLVGAAALMAAAPPAGSWTSPFGGADGFGRPVTQPFGAHNPRRGGWHTGVDLAAPCGTPVRAMAAGRIERATPPSANGRGGRLVLRVSTGSAPVYVQYAHLSRLDTHEGAGVGAGERLGAVGRARSGAPCHLHLAVRAGRAPGAGYIDAPPVRRGYLDPARVAAGAEPRGSRQPDPGCDMVAAMIDHLTTYATDYDATRRFYAAALGALGHEICIEMTARWDPEWPERRMCAFGSGGKPTFWVLEVKEVYTPRHVAFRATDRDEVDAFHAAALGAGGTDNGAPGPRPHYHAGYYGGFAHDPDGNNVEAVAHGTGPAASDGPPRERPSD